MMGSSILHVVFVSVERRIATQYMPIQLLVIVKERRCPIIYYYIPFLLEMVMKYLIVHVKVGSVDFMYVTTVNNGYEVITGGRQKE
jgi:hypothetical protein